MSSHTSFIARTVWLYNFIAVNFSHRTLVMNVIRLKLSPHI